MLSRAFVRSVHLDWGKVTDARAYPFSIPAVRALDPLPLHEKLTFLTGENGSGKSTLIEGLAAALGFCPEGGGWNFRLETQATHSPLYQYLRLERGPLPPRDGYFLRAESFYNVATYIDELDRQPAAAPPIGAAYGGSLHTCSHGESFFALLANRLGPHGLYLFDEPEAALSPMRQMAMLRRLHELAQAGCQMVIATHSPILLAYPDCLIYQLDEEGMRPIAYEECGPYRVTRRFLTDYPRMVARLLDEDDEAPDAT